MMKKQKVNTKEIRIRNRVLSMMIVSIFLMLLSLAIIYFFEYEDFWLSICLIFYSFLCGYHAMITAVILPTKKSIIIENRKIKKSITLCIFLNILLIIINFFPFALMSENFIKWINIILGLDLHIKYEGGVIVSLLTLFCIGTLTLGLIGLCYAAKKNCIKTKYGFILAAVFVISIVGFCVKKIKNNPNYDCYIISQSEKVNRELDDNIQYYRMKKYKRILDRSY